MLRWWKKLFRGYAAPSFDPASSLDAWFASAAASGKPRGLKWSNCEALGDAVFVRDGSRRLALIPVRVRFEPLPEGGFEDIPQATEPRHIVVMFTQEGGKWDTGRALFNVTMESLTKRFC